jgi:hypothetical protein
MTNPEVFYNKEDLWSFPIENTSSGGSVVAPYYVIMKLPGGAREEFILMQPMTPSKRGNMVAWLAARCDPPQYGELVEYEFPKERLVFGPQQIEARIDQDTTISQELSLWNQMGSKVIRGNLLVIPVEDSLVYVERLYLRSEQGQIPELKRVIVAYNDRLAMAPTLEAALAAVFKPAAAPARVVEGPANPGAGGDGGEDGTGTLPGRVGGPPRRRLDGLRAEDGGAREGVGTLSERRPASGGREPVGSRATSLASAGKAGDHHRTAGGPVGREVLITGECGTARACLAARSMRGAYLRQPCHRALEVDGGHQVEMRALSFEPYSPAADEGVCQVTPRRTTAWSSWVFGPRSRPGSVGRLFSQEFHERFEQVAAGDDSDYAAGTDHREGADSLTTQQPCGVVERCVRLDGEHLVGHHVLDRDGARVRALR